MIRSIADRYRTVKNPDNTSKYTYRELTRMAYETIMDFKDEHMRSGKLISMQFNEWIIMEKPREPKS